MKPGDIVQLKQPFAPRPGTQESYQFGIVAGLAQLRSNGRPKAAQVDSLLLHLYDPDQATTYTDELGAKAVFLFQSDEVEPWEH